MLFLVDGAPLLVSAFMYENCHFLRLSFPPSTLVSSFSLVESQVFCRPFANRESFTLLFQFLGLIFSYLIASFVNLRETSDVSILGFWL